VHGPLNITVEPGTSTGDELVLKHQGAPEFDPPEHYDPILLRGDHIVTFKVRLPDRNASQEVKDLLDKIVENEEANKERYYAHWEERKRRKQAEIDRKMADKRAQSAEKMKAKEGGGR